MHTETAKLATALMLLLGLVLTPVASIAGDLGQPAGKVILSVSGFIDSFPAVELRFHVASHT